MIKCVIDNKILVCFKIIFISQHQNTASFFNELNRDFYYVIVNLDNNSVLKESKKFYDLPDFNLKNLLNEYQNEKIYQSIKIKTDKILSPLSLN